MRENLTTGSTPFRKAYLRSLIDVIEVDDTQIRIKGTKDVLERAVLASRSGAEQRSQMSSRTLARFAHLVRDTRPDFRRPDPIEAAPGSSARETKAVEGEKVREFSALTVAPQLTKVPVIRSSRRW